jgi:ribosomal protein S18 acetylase RimI-like enzyme
VDGRGADRASLGDESKVRIRPRAPEDLDALVRVATRVREVDGYPVYLPDNDFQAFLTSPPSLAAWVAEVDGRVVGHVALNTESHAAAMARVREAGIAGRLGVVARLLVDPSVRRQGIGLRLLDQATVAARRLGGIPVLDVVATSTSAINLYRENGWKEVGRCRFEIPGEDPVEEIVFVLPTLAPDGALASAS